MEVETALRSLNEAVQAIEVTVDQGERQPPDIRKILAAVERRIVNVRERATGGDGSNFRQFGFDRRKMREALKISVAGLTWLVHNGHIPPPDCNVPSYEWRSAGKYAVDVVDEGWSPEVAEKIIATAGELRQVYADRQKKKQTGKR